MGKGSICSSPEADVYPCPSTLMPSSSSLVDMVSQLPSVVPLLVWIKTQVYPIKKYLTSIGAYRPSCIAVYVAKKY